MKRFLLLCLIVFGVISSARAQPANKSASLTGKASAIPIACSADYKGLIYRDYQNPIYKTAHRCDGLSWVDISNTGGGNLSAPSVKDKVLKERGLPKTFSQKFGIRPEEFLKSNARNVSYKTLTTDFRKQYLYNYPAFNPFPVAKAQDTKRFELSGAFSVGYSNSRARTTPINDSLPTPIGNETKSSELSLGLDLHLGTYIIDPRFMTLSADVSLARDKGSFDDYETRNGIRGLGFAVDFLPTSPYPFRFRYVHQNSNFLNRQDEATNSARSVIGFNWQLRKPDLPALSVNFDKISFDSKFLASSFFKTDARTFSIAATDTFRGWNLNSSYNYQSTVERVTDFKTRQNFLQFNARKQFSDRFDMFVGSFFEKLRFANDTSGSDQNTSLFDVHTDLNYRPTEKIGTRFSHRFYYNANSMKISFRDGSNTNRANFLDSTSYFNSFGGQLTYRLSSDLTVGGATNLNLVNAPSDIFETATQLFDVAATASWNKKIGSAYFHVSALEGIAYARSNFENHRNIGFRNYNAGVTFGKVQQLLVSADYNYSYRPDIFQIGGFFSDNNLSLNFTTEALNPFRLHASFGDNRVVYLTSRGREGFDNMFYSAGVEHRLFSFQYARNLNDSVRDIFASDFTVPINRMFIVLPTDTLVRDPFLRTRGNSNTALFRIQPRHALIIEFRYLDDKSFFVAADDVSVRQFDGIASYKLGKFIFSGGVSRQRQMTEGQFSRTRNYFFLRATRTFKIF